MANWWTGHKVWSWRHRQLKIKVEGLDLQAAITWSHFQNTIRCYQSQPQQHCEKDTALILKLAEITQEFVPGYAMDVRLYSWTHSIHQTNINKLFPKLSQTHHANSTNPIKYQCFHRQPSWKRKLHHPTTLPAALHIGTSTLKCTFYFWFQMAFFLEILLWKGQCCDESIRIGTYLGWIVSRHVESYDQHIGH